jgi:hypothetical protein
MQTLKVDVSAEERNALLTVHRLLLVGAGDKEFTSTFWQIVRAEDPREISWEDATGLVRNGAIHTICQDHDLRVLLYARDGRKYRTREPHIDDVGRIRAEVDPTGVFIRLVTE